MSKAKTSELSGRALDWAVAAALGDRVEVYRPLTVDPMEARRRRHKR